MPETTVMPSDASSLPEASKDPLSKMVDIAKDKDLSDADKSALIKYAQQRFVNRRRMAYVALSAIVISLFLILLAAFIDGFSTCPEGETCRGILEAVKDSQTLIAWIEGFLTSIVAAYYGISAWRPAS